MSPNPRATLGRGQVTCAEGENSASGFVQPLTTSVQSMRIVLTNRSGKPFYYTFNSKDLEGKTLADFSDDNLESTIADIAIKANIPLTWGDKLEVAEMGYQLDPSAKLYKDSQSSDHQSLGSAIKGPDKGDSIICDYEESPTLFYQANCQNKQICFGKIKCMNQGREEKSSPYCSAVKKGDKFFCPTATACWTEESNLAGYPDQATPIHGKTIKQKQEQGYQGEWYEKPGGAVR